MMLEMFESVSPGILLTAIHPLDKTKPPHTARFADIQSAHRWAAQYNAAGWNIYFHVNLGEGDGRLGKADVTFIRAIYLDLDPPDGMQPWPVDAATYGAWADAKLSELVALRPSYLMHSGRGLQAFWLFPEPLPASDRNIGSIESYTKALGLMVAGDGSVHDVARIMKLPGYLAYPNQAKAAAGWQPSPAQILPGGLGRPLTLQELENFVKLLIPHIPQEQISASTEPWGTDSMGLPLSPVAAIRAALAQPLTPAQQKLREQIVKKITSSKGPKGSRNAQAAQQGLASREDGDASAVWWWMMHAAAEVTDDLAPVAKALIHDLSFAKKTYDPTGYSDREHKCLAELGKQWPKLAAEHRASKQARMEKMKCLIDNMTKGKQNV